MHSPPTAEVSAPEVDELMPMPNRLLEDVGSVILGKPEVIKLAVVALLAEGHVLVEDVPGPMIGAEGSIRSPTEINPIDGTILRTDARAASYTEVVADVPRQVVEAFYWVRFGRRDLAPGALRDLEGRLDALEARLRGTRE